MQLVQLMEVCLRRMFVKFNIWDYASAQRLAESLIILITEREDSIIFRLSIYPCKYVLISPSLLYGIDNPVLRLIPIYKYANNALNWRRMATLFTNADIIPETLSRPQPSLLDFLHFMDIIQMEFRHLGNCRTTLIINSETRIFVFDTLMDSYVLVEHGVCTLFDKNQDTPRRVNQFLNGFSK